MTAGGQNGLFARVPPALLPLDRKGAASALAEVTDAAEQRREETLAARLRAKDAAASFLAAAFDLSPFLRDTARKRPEIVERLFREEPGGRLAAIGSEMAAAALAPDATEASLMTALRRLKAEAHVTIALAELAGEADTETTVRRLSALAERATAAAVDWLLRDLHRAGKLALADPARPSEGSGLVVLGMGKLGGEELNFSSDIDLIVFFDPRAGVVPDASEAGELWARLTRRLVRVLNERTADGYVFRTDLRLRPDPGSTPLAISTDAALLYYEGRGQNWERAAMIKARPVAGDRAAGERFLAELRPYVWRKYLDFAAIADVHSIKRQIHVFRGHGEVAVRGHDIKLGRGGIREIEFFVQTQQLIAGGRAPELRGRQTVPMLAELARRGWITAAARDALARCYWLLRRVENALQTVRDEQTHVLPDDERELRRVARLSGFKDERDFEARLRAAFSEVETHYAKLFEAAPELSSGLGNLVFTGDVDDPGTVETLISLGFERPSDIIRTVRSWHFGRYRATRSAEARERLTELTPALLEAFAATGRPDEALVAFDAFLAGLPAGIQLFSLLNANRALLDLLVTILGTAPRLAAIVTRRPHVFDGLLDPTLLSDLPDRPYLASRLEAFLGAARGHEEVLDRLRIFAAEQKLLIGVRLLTGAIPPGRAGEAFSDLADLTIAAALDAVEREFVSRHGRVEGGSVALLGMGKLGSRELTAGSDVDLILLYEHAPDALESDGPKPLAPSHYYARLTQRLIAAVSAPTGEGVLYELDLRLRPSGNKGPLAVHVEAFGRYQRHEAWSWEHMALTRARVVAGDAALARRIDEEVAAVLRRPRDGAKLRLDARDMRALILEEKPPSGPWDLKLVPGGLIDLEFIAQVAALSGGLEEGARHAGTRDNLQRLAASFAEPEARDELVAAFDLYAAVTQLVRLCLTGRFEPNGHSAGLMELLLRATGLPGRTVLEAHLAETGTRVAFHFARLIGGGRG